MDDVMIGMDGCGVHGCLRLTITSLTMAKCATWTPSASLARNGKVGLFTRISRTA